MRFLRHTWARLAGLDARSLALMRMSLGLVLLVDLAVRAMHFRMFYTDQGVLPLEVLYRHGLSPGDWSLYALHGSLWSSLLLYLLHGLAAVSLTLGYRTTASSLLCWLLTSSLQDRNFAVLNAGDSWLRMILLWGIFLPWGRCWSLDQLSTTPSTSPTPAKAPLRKEGVREVASLATFAYLLQEVSVYLFSGLAKSGSSWWPDGSAIYYAFQLNEWSSSLARYPLYFPQLMRLLSYLVLAGEVVLPLLLLSPWARGQLRGVVVVLILAFHGSLMLTMKLGMFPAVGMAAALGLLPSQAWRLGPMRRLESLLSQLYDHPTWARWAPSPFPRPRPWVGRLLRLFSQTLLALLVLASLGWNLARLQYGNQMPARWKTRGHLLTVDQNWALFAPDPPQDTGWMVVEGVLSDGRVIDLLHPGQPATRQRPPTPADLYSSQREKRYFVVLGNPTYRALYKPYSDYLFHRWAEEHPGQPLSKIRLIWISQRTLADFEDRPPLTHLRFEASAPRPRHDSAGR